MNTKNIEQSYAIPDLLFKIVNQYPNKTALIFNSEVLSYRELWHQSTQIASVLQRMGVRKGDKIAVKLTRCLELYLVLVALIRLGAVVVPLSQSNPAQYQADCIRTADVSLLISDTDEMLKSKENSSLINCPFISVENLFLETRDLGYIPVVFETLIATDPVMILLTSGSTGKPKSVIIRHCGLARLAIPASQLGNTDNDRYLQLTEPAFAASTSEIWMSLLTGATLVIYPSNIPDLVEINNIIEHRNISILFLSGGLFRLFVEVSPGTLHKPNCVIVSGDFVNPRLFSFAAKAGKGRIFNGMGCTENSSISAIYEVLPTEILDPDTPVPIGCPFPLVKMVVLDDNLEICGPDIPGELCISGAGLAEGYSDPVLTKERFVWLDLNGSYERYYRTDDRARRDKFGNITLLGRGNHICKIRGFRTEITGVEHILRSHPQIEDVIVTIEQTSNEPLLHACYLSKSGPLPDIQLREFMNAKLPSYMVPERITHVNSLPMNKNGKRDRLKMAQLIADGMHKQNDFERDSVQTKILLIWEEITGYKDLDPATLFWEQGVNSLHLIKLASLVSKTLGVHVSPADVFSAGSVEKLATQLRKNWLERKDGK
ncbi:amino acid adenylation domain-containing protein [Xenorhabdus cabanillasii]|uniref:Amino acid adenylation domain-containing protein n=1 Tax=Xenorhabdus cabanillasii TaxID=351673 RepID=A0A3D9UG32_9GAMM|nr:AMP-binding protein [Xenorhabdus cabanillasii]REF28227.1 amino acid adenylation domain-containing protein [Xenorhabdus cabanillasii]